MPIRQVYISDDFIDDLLSHDPLQDRAARGSFIVSS